MVISHAHIDHFGWVGRFTGESDAAVYVHELDARVLVNFEERIVLASKDLRVFMERAGVKPELRTEIEEAYRWSRNFFKSVEIDHLVQDRDRIINGYRVHHTLRHCPGQICLEVHDLLFTADHVLSRITASVAGRDPPFCGLELYLQSLDKVRGLEGIRVSPPATKRPSRTSTAGSRASWATTSGGSARCSTSAMSRWRWWRCPSGCSVPRWATRTSPGPRRGGRPRGISLPAR